MTVQTSTHHCIQCGAQMAGKEIEGRMREVCPDCGWIHYEQLKVGAAALIEDQGRLLLLKRAHDPWRGDWNLPAGYVEVDEPPARAAERETLEETGLDVKATHLVNGYYFDDDPRGNGVLLLYACEIVGGERKRSQEVLEMDFFSPMEIPDNICGAGHKDAIADWVSDRDDPPGRLYEDGK